MSNNNEELITIEIAQLTTVNGGDNNSARVEIHGPAGVGLNVQGGSVRSNYERCLEMAQRTARERFPDPRSPVDVLTNRPDPNAARRADYEREGVRMCGAPPQG